MLFCKPLNSVRYLSLINNCENGYKYLRLSGVLRVSKAFNSNLLIRNTVKHKSQINSNFIQFQNFSNHENLNNKCWKCLKTNESKVILFCDKCHAIQALNPSINYFELFQINVSFDVNLSKLSQSFRSLQMHSHPDKFAQKSQREHQYSMDNSSLINKAYKTLYDPYERGQYLLQILFGSSIQETDNGIDTQFLNTIMKLNEDIETNDTSEEGLIKILQQNEGNIKKIINEISIAFSSQNGIRAKELLAKFKFYISANIKLKERLQN